MGDNRPHGEVMILRDGYWPSTLMAKGWYESLEEFGADAVEWIEDEGAELKIPFTADQIAGAAHLGYGRWVWDFCERASCLHPTQPGRGAFKMTYCDL